MKSLLAPVGSLVATAALAQTPAGAWKTVDDATGKGNPAVIRITETNGVFTGKIEKLLDPTKQDSKCDECTDDRKGKPVIGPDHHAPMSKGQVLGGWRHPLSAANGKGLPRAPEPQRRQQKLDVRGYFGNPLFGRTQTWTRLE